MRRISHSREEWHVQAPVFAWYFVCKESRHLNKWCFIGPEDRIIWFANLQCFNSTFMNLKFAWFLLNAKCEIVVFTQCSRQWLLNCDNQNIVHLVAYIYVLISNEEISKIEKTYLKKHRQVFLVPDWLVLIYLSKTRVPNHARGSPRGTLMPSPRAAIKSRMPHPRDWQREQMPRGCPEGMGTTGIDWCINLHPTTTLFPKVSRGPIVAHSPLLEFKTPHISKFSWSWVKQEINKV